MDFSTPVQVAPSVYRGIPWALVNPVNFLNTVLKVALELNPGLNVINMAGVLEKFSVFPVPFIQKIYPCSTYENHNTCF